MPQFHLQNEDILLLKNGLLDGWLCAQHIDKYTLKHTVPDTREHTLKREIQKKSC